MKMKLSQFNYNLPSNLVAIYPEKNRDESRLMVFHKDSGKIEHKVFKDVINYFNEKDILVLKFSRPGYMVIKKKQVLRLKCFY